MATSVHPQGGPAGTPFPAEHRRQRASPGRRQADPGSFRHRTPSHCRPSHGHKLVGLGILKLDDLMTSSGKLAPPVRLAGVLLDGSVPAFPHGESHGLEALLAGAAEGEPLALNLDLVSAQQLFGDRA